MNSYKKTNIAWANEIPLTWQIAPNKFIMKKIKNICFIRNDEDIISLSIKGVTIRDLDAGGKMPSSFDGYQFVYPGNLLMCLFDYDVTPRCIGYIRNFGITSPAYSQFLLKNKNSAKFYYYYYLMIDDKKSILYLAKNLRHSFTEEELGRIAVVVPPLEEQKAIADYLDGRCGQIDDISKIIEKQIETLEQYKRSIITETVTKGMNPDVNMKDSGIEWIGEIPEHWKVIKGKFLFKNEKQIVGAKVDDFERLALTMNGVIKRSKDDNEGLQPEKFNSYQILRQNELVFKLIDLQNISTSRVGLSPYVGIVSPAYIILKSNASISPKYAEKYYLSLWMNQIFNYLGDAGVRSSLNSSELLNLSLPIPPLEEQKAIADYLDGRCGQIDEIIKGKREQLEQLKSYKQSMIYEYVTGKRRVSGYENK